MFCQLFSLQNKSFLCLQHIENKGFQTVIKHRLKAIQKHIKNELGNREKKNTKNAHFVLKKCTFRFRDYTMAATDLLPYVRYSRASVVILWLAVLAMPVAIFSTTLLYIVGPAVLLALLFFNLEFIALGSSYIPTEELLDKEENQRAEEKKPVRQLSEERRNFIQNNLDQWCMDLGYKDCNVNMLTLSHKLCISKSELSLFFDQCLHSNFRIWLSEIRLNAAKKMMLKYPDYSNDIISAECGFSCRTHLYRIFKTKEGCSPTEWRDSQHTDAAQNDSNEA